MSKRQQKIMVSVLDRIFLEPLRFRPQCGTQQTAQESSPSSRSKRPGTEVIDTDDLLEDDIIIAIMGPTGAGKSTFIQAATGHAGSIGDALQSCTTEIGSIKSYDPDRSPSKIVLVDTPGFDDTNKSDVEILSMIADWLEKTYKRQIKLTGIVYLHRISDNRMGGTPLKNLRMFGELCGKEALQRVILTTTMWDDVEEDEGERRETDLRTNFWKSMLDCGSSTARFDGTPNSAWKILKSLTNEPRPHRPLQLQKEIVDLGRQLADTRAGRPLFNTLEALIQRQRVMMQKIRAGSNVQSNEAVVVALHKECEDIQQQLAKVLFDMRVSKIPLCNRFKRPVSLVLGVKKM